MKEYLAAHPKLIAGAIFVLIFLFIGVCVAYPPVFAVSLFLLMLAMLCYIVWEVSRHAAVKIARRLRR
ncbi:MAG: hypothetical protein Q8761_02665 [Sweet potato little leaf phytoplasma]|nr:hypothetical protein [Sweet potato little leaf phytoplasma]